jgi:type II secretory pathway pseudopilin PulG
VSAGSRGFSLFEALLVLALLSGLALLGLGRLEWGRTGLGAVQGELRGALEQALLRARDQGCDLRVALRSGAGAIRPLVLPPGVRWGLPRGVPPPPGMAPTTRAHLTGEAHDLITVTPNPSATAAAWFLHDGQDALCLRLSGQGRPQLLRWRHRPGQWSRL